MLARGGTYSVVGYGGTIAMPSPSLVVNEHDAWSATSWAPGSTSGSFSSCTPPGRLVLKTEMHPLDSVNDVLAKLREGEVTGRAVLVPG